MKLLRQHNQTNKPARCNPNKNYKQHRRYPHQHQTSNKDQHGATNIINHNTMTLLKQHKQFNKSVRYNHYKNVKHYTRYEFRQQPSSKHK